jgi:hypothetical protein
MNEGELADVHGEIISTPEIRKATEEKNQLCLAIIKKYYLHSE